MEKRVSPMPTEAQRRCFLLELPPELRLRIYEHVFEGICRCTLTVCNDLRVIRNHVSWWGANYSNLSGDQHRWAAVLETCKLVAHEATPVLYAATTFTVAVREVHSANFPPPAKAVDLLQSCRPLALIKKIDMLQITLQRHRTDGHPVAKLVEGVTNLLGMYAAVKITALLAGGWSDAMQLEAWRVYSALPRLRCEKGAKSYRRHGFNTTRKAYEEVYETFLQKLGTVDMP